MRTRAEEDETITAINVAPLVDIGLVLLVVMMIALSYAATRAIPMELPEGEGAEAVVEPFRVAIAADGSLSVGADAVSALELAERARRFARSRNEPRAVVAADPSAAHGAFVSVIDVLRTAGVRHYTVALPAD